MDQLARYILVFMLSAVYGQKCIVKMYSETNAPFPLKERIDLVFPMYNYTK